MKTKVQLKRAIERRNKMMQAIKDLGKQVKTKKEESPVEDTRDSNAPVTSEETSS